MKKIIETSKAPAPVGPYSQAVEVNGFLYCSGQIAINPESGELVLGNISSETTQVMQNVKAVLDEAQLGFENVFKTAIFLTSMSDFKAVNEVYAEYFKTNPPARSCVAVKELPKGVNVEIEVIAFKG